MKVRYITVFKHAPIHRSLLIKLESLSIYGIIPQITSEFRSKASATGGQFHKNICAKIWPKPELKLIYAESLPVFGSSAVHISMEVCEKPKTNTNLLWIYDSIIDI